MHNCVQVLDSPGFSAGHARGTWSLAALDYGVKAVDHAERALLLAVRQARADGHSWQLIGDHLGVTRQAAHLRFSKLM